MKHLDLFSGIGGFALAAKWCGIETLEFVEKDGFCQKILEKNFPGIKISNDIVGYEYKEKNVDLITAGFPCQDISQNGKRAGIEGKRSGLWGETKRVLEEVQPNFAIVENVANLRSLGLGRVLKDLWEIGYNAEWHIIPARSVGTLHQRERIFIIAHAMRLRMERILEEGFYREPCFSWHKDVRCIEDLRERSLLFTPTLCGVVDGVPNRSHRLKALGNAIVPQIAKQIFEQVIQENERINN